MYLNERKNGYHGIYICRFNRKTLEILSEYSKNEDKLRALFKLI